MFLRFAETLTYKTWKRSPTFCGNASYVLSERGTAFCGNDLSVIRFVETWKRHQQKTPTMRPAFLKKKIKARL